MTVTTTELRARFAAALSELYGSEVPAYTTLVDVAREVNRDAVTARGHEAERLGDLDRVTAERHGAIRVGTPAELAQVARLFGAFGMAAVGFYDLRAGDGNGVPVVSTAFRPVGHAELAANPFRVFTSMLTVDDARFFDPDTRHRLHAFLGARQLFDPALLALADRACDEGRLPAPDADVLVRSATRAFRLSREPVDAAWYDHLASISSVAADIGGVPTTHINHLTPRVLDITELYARMRAEGVSMIDAIQGPPAWGGPEVLLRQTSFRALAEARRFRRPDGSVVDGTLRVRFGEVEQRGVALTPAGMRRYEQASADHAWAEHFPASEAELAAQGLGWFTYAVTGADRPGSTALSALVAAGTLEARPVVYEDFLPRSAAGIFRSNLAGAGSRDDTVAGVDYDIDRLSGIVAQEIHDPQDLYGEQRRASLDEVARRLGTPVTDDITPT